MPIQKHLMLSLILAAIFLGCGADPGEVDGPPPTTPADSPKPVLEKEDAVRHAPPADDPFLSPASPSDDTTTADETEAPRFEEKPSDEPVFEEPADGAGESNDAAENDDSSAATVADDADEIALVDADADDAATANDSGSADESTEGSEARYTRRQRHDPNGIGKFYMGREIAQVMGYVGAPWLERNTREEEERLTLLIKALDLQPGQVVADIGAGSGVITLMMAPLVEPDGRIIAVDVQQKMLNLIKKKLVKYEVENVDLVKGTPKSPKLKPESVDVAIMVDVYHEFEFPYEMLLELSKALKPEGKIVFVEYRMEDPTVPIKLVHKMSVAQVKKEAGQPEFGLEYVETIDVLPRQHIVVFRKPAQSASEEVPE